jgi:glycosyltransferase 2 family protein
MNDNLSGEKRVCVLRKPLIGLIRINSWQRWIINLSITIIFLILFFSNVNLSGWGKSFLEIKIFPLSLSIFLAIIMRVIWAYQVSFGITPLGLSLKVRDLFRFNIVTTFYSLLFPGDLIAGTIAWYKLSFPIRKEIEVGTLLTYFRLLNTLTLLIIGGIGAWFDPYLGTPQIRIIIAIMLFGVFTLFIPFFRTPLSAFVKNIGNKILLKFPLQKYLYPLSSRVWASIEVFQNIGIHTMILLIGISFIFHLTGILTYYLLTIALDIHMSIFLVGWVRSFLNILHSIPITIGGLGVRETSIVYILTNYGVTSTKAFSFSLAVFCLILVPGILGGLVEGWNLIYTRR